MKEPVWLSKKLILAIHGRLLAEHGGSSGRLDEGLLESALAAAKNHFLHEDPDIFGPAAAYAFAITRDHPFVDGNKRTALTAAGVSLELNGYRLNASEADAVSAVLAISNSQMNSTEFAAWLRLCSAAVAAPFAK